MFFRHFRCGSFNPKAKRDEEESQLPWKRPSIVPTKPSKRSRIKSFFSSSRKSKETPYSTAELNEMRQNIIYTQNREVFVYSSSTNFTPVVAKQKNNNQSEEPDNLVILTIKEQFKERSAESNGLGKERSLCSSKKMEPCWYLAAALVLILLLVDSFGKPFAVFCCSVFWHLVPASRGKESTVRRQSMKNVKKKIRM